MALTRDTFIYRPDGSRVKHGLVSRTLTETFIGASALPSWLTLSSGTGSFGSVASTRGYYQMATAASFNSTSVLKTAFSIDPQYFREIWWELDGVELQKIAGESNGWFWYALITNSARTIGGSLEVRNVGTSAFLAYPSGGNITRDLKWNPFRANSTTNLCARSSVAVVMFPQEKAIAVCNKLQNGKYDVVHQERFSAWNGGTTVQPEILLWKRDNAAVTQWARFSQISLTLVHN